MAVIFKGGFKHILCKISTMLPLDWGQVANGNQVNIDFQPLTLTSNPARMDFGPIQKSN